MPNFVSFKILKSAKIVFGLSFENLPIPNSCTIYPKLVIQTPSQAEG